MCIGSNRRPYKLRPDDIFFGIFTPQMKAARTVVYDARVRFPSRLDFHVDFLIPVHKCFLYRLHNTILLFARTFSEYNNIAVVMLTHIMCSSKPQPNHTRVAVSNKLQSTTV